MAEALSDLDRRILDARLKFLRAQASADPMLQEPPRLDAVLPRTPEGALRAQVAQQFGVDPRSVDPTLGLGLAGRASLGALADEDPNESIAALQRKYPGAKVAPVGEGVFGVQELPRGPVRLSNPSGADLGDVAEGITRYGPNAAGVVAGTAAGTALGGTGILATVAPYLGAAFGAGVTRWAREGVQALAGTQRESLGSVAGQSAVDAGVEFIPLAGKGIKAGYNILRGRGGAELGRLLQGATANDVELLATELRDAGVIDIPKLMVYQRSDNPLVSSVARQVMQMSPVAKQRVIAQLNDLGTAARSAGPQVEGSVDELVQGKLASQYNRTLGELAPPVRPVEAGASLGQGVTESLAQQKTRMGQQYNALFGYLEQNPKKFNLGQAQQSALSRNIPGELSEDEINRQLAALTAPDGTVDLSQVQQFINVAKPNEKLARINTVLQRLNPEQDFRVVKELRTQVGALRDLPLAQRLEGGVDQGQIKAVYGDLTRAMENPVDGDKAFKARMQETNRIASDYYDNYDNQQVLAVLSAVEGKTPGLLFNQFAKAPDNLTPDLLRLVDESAKPSTTGLVKGNLESAIMRTPDPYATIQNWEKTAPDALGWLYPNRAALTTARQNAKLLRDMNTGPYKEAADAAVTEVGFAQKTLEHFAKREPGTTGLVGPRASRFQGLINEVGGAGSEGHRALRSAVISKVTGKALREHPSGAMTLDPRKLATSIQDLKDHQYWTGLLTPRDRKVLIALEGNSRRMWKTGDSGTGLTIAAQIGRARHGDLGALANIWSSQLFADLLTRESIDPMDLIRFLPSRAAAGGGGLSHPAMEKTLNAIKAGVGPSIRQGVVAPLVQESIDRERVTPTAGTATK